MQLEGKYIKTIERNSFTKWTLFTIKEKSSQLYINCEGVIPALVNGEDIILSGKKTASGCFYVDSYICPDHNNTVKNTLISGLFSGIGEITASAILDSINNTDIYEYIDTHKHLPKIKGLTPEKEAEIIKYIKNTKSLKEFIIFSDELGIPYKDATSIYERYGRISKELLNKTPFKLANEGYISIYTADKIAKNSNLFWLCDERVDAFIIQCLINAQMYGNTYISIEQLPRFIKYICERSAYNDIIPDLILIKRLLALKDNKKIIIIDVKTDKRIYLKEMYELELMAARELKRLENNKIYKELDNKIISQIETNNGFAYSKNQKNAFNCFKSSGVKIINGGPGTGKTTVINGLLKYIKHTGGTFVLCAPTGRASQRLSEVTGEVASTIHKLLEIRPYGHDFICKGKENPINADYVIIDEMSMVGIEIFAKLINALKNGTTLILVGDYDQLQSVQPGNVLEELLKISNIYD